MKAGFSAHHAHPCVLKEEQQPWRKTAAAQLRWFDRRALDAKNLPTASSAVEVARAWQQSHLTAAGRADGRMNRPRPGDDAFIRRLRDELGSTILLIEHQMRVVMGISETVTVLDYAKRSRSTPAEIQRNPR